MTFSGFVYNTSDELIFFFFFEVNTYTPNQVSTISATGVLIEGVSPLEQHVDQHLSDESKMISYQRKIYLMAGYKLSHLIFLLLSHRKKLFRNPKTSIPDQSMGP